VNATTDEAGDPTGEETRDQQLTRNVSELLSEVRVAQAAVQILFGFLLSVAFTDTFRHAAGFEKVLHLSAVLLTATSTALLTAPAVWHRTLFRGGRREDILRAGNRAALVGMGCLATAMTLTVALIGKVVFGVPSMIVFGSFAAVLFALLWFAAPHRLRDSRQQPGTRD
jgi:uncharacterized membrane protein